VLKNFKLTIEYDGSAYHGWQRQKDRRTIQGEIENALRTMTGRPVTLIGSGRTDAGVHALGQVANFRCDTGLSSEVFQRGINGIVQNDIVILSCERVEDGFHARYDAKSKTYRYRILNRLIPAAIGRQYAWHIRDALNIDAMRTAVSHIVGHHDFKAFEGAGSPKFHTFRRVMKADWFVRDDGCLAFEVEADGFLRFMVRNIVGTLADVGRGKLTPDDFNRVFRSRDRGLTGATAPACGLFLMEVKY
jgi:tRNA pseudouridine38-40 synthase